MPGVIFLLDEVNHARVEALWDQMEREFGVARGYPGAMPHFTIHLAAEYGLDATRAIVGEVARTQRPFAVPTSGLGVFTGEMPILYIPVIRTRTLDDLHSRLYQELAPHCSGHFPYYSPESWMPHITIGQVNLAPQVLPALLEWLAHQPLSWQLEAATLAIAGDTGISVELFGTFPLLG